MTIEKMQREGEVKKNKTESTQMAIMNAIERKYKDQLKEMVESNQLLITELSQKTKSLEKENKLLMEKLEVEQRGKLSDHGTMEKKMTELIENERRLSEEVEVLKQERDKKLVEYQRSLEKERET